LKISPDDKQSQSMRKRGAVLHSRQFKHNSSLRMWKRSLEKGTISNNQALLGDCQNRSRGCWDHGASSVTSPAMGKSRRIRRSHH